MKLFTSDHKHAYKQIRNYLAGRFVGATRDEALLEEVLKCLFCKVTLNENGYDGRGLDEIAIAKTYRNVFSELKRSLATVFSGDEEILLDPVSIAYVDDLLNQVEVENPLRDPFGDLYEVFAGPTIKGKEGQFFTPQNAVGLLISLVDLQPDERVIDPACGAGSFLSAAAKHMMKLGMPREEIVNHVFGIDKDSYLARLATCRLAPLMKTQPNVYCGDSLAWTTETNEELPLEMGNFDVVLANPPFGSKIISASVDVLKGFDLGYKWKFDSKSQRYIKTETLPKNVPPQVLFIERCLSLVRPGGRIGIVIPESLVSGKSYRHVVQYIRERAEIKAVVGMPESLFKTSGKGGTHTKTCLVFLEKAESSKNGQSKSVVFMAEAKWCGHDSRGRLIEYDDLPEIRKNYSLHTKGRRLEPSHLGYAIRQTDLVDNILAPRYYDLEVAAELSALAKTHHLMKVSDLVSSGLLQITTGHEVGKLAYGTGPIPFVRTSDISNWEIKIDPKHRVSEEIFLGLKQKQDVRPGDILMVKDGTYLIGTCAFVTKYDTKIVFQSHLYKLRITNHDRLSPYLLIAVLGSSLVRRQIQAKRLSQDIIDSLGSRIQELVLPIPKAESTRNMITQKVERAINERIEARELTRQACEDVLRA